MLIHGFGSYPLFFFKLLKALPEKSSSFEWSILLTSASHLDAAHRHFPPERIHYLQRSIKQRMRDTLVPNVLSDLPSSVHECIDSDKRTVKRWSGEKQLRYAIAVYEAYKELLQRIAPDLLFFPPGETAEAKILAGIAEELSIEVVSCLNARHLGGSFFSEQLVEALPSYAEADPASIEAAKTFIRTFRSEGLPAVNVRPIAERLQEPEPADVDRMTEGLPSRGVRLKTYARSWLDEPDGTNVEGIRIRMMNTLPLISPALRMLVRGSRKRGNAAYIEPRAIKAFPEKFIYYPLQYSPESSINLPAPYFVDQLRVVDAIRHNMPNDCFLLVKEHPAALEMRPRSFLRALAGRSGVVFASTDTSSREIIGRAALTISVTGSAAFEAFLLGRPSLVLGSCFFADFLGGITELDQLGGAIRSKIGKAIADDEVVNSIARAFNCISPFLFIAPDYGNGAKYALRLENMRAFLTGFEEHLRRRRATARPEQAHTGNIAT